jgi:hypothetical protein
MRGNPIWPAALALACTVAAGVADAETLRYSIEIPEGRSVTYELELQVRHPGPLTVRAEWPGGRTLSLKLTPADAGQPAILRSGPSPLVLQTIVERVGPGEDLWRLRVHSITAGGGGTGALAIDLPDAQEASRQPTPPGPAEPPRGPDAPWLRPRPIDHPVPADWLGFLQAAEAYRSQVVGDSSAPLEDACRWQEPLMRYLATERETLLDGGPPPADSTARLLRRMASAVRAVDAIRTSRDPMLSGPPPDDDALRETWVRLRSTRIEPVEDELDSILGMVQRDHASDLEDQSWPIRFVSCLTACERFFEQQPRLGAERAANRELAEAQWPTVLAAADALAALAELGGDERAPQ